MVIGQQMKEERQDQEIFRKDVAYDNNKITKKQKSMVLPLHIFGKTIGGGQIDLPAFLELSAKYTNLFKGGTFISDAVVQWLSLLHSFV